MTKMMKLNKKDIKRIFKEYDLNKNGSIDYEELRDLLLDLGLDSQFGEYADPEAAFNQYLAYQWYQTDKNGNGFISYEEFIDIHNNLIDK